MHSFQSSGYTIHHNGDYSGPIKIEDADGVELPELEFEQILNMVSANTSSPLPLVNALRDLVADAIRSEVISLWEQMDTDTILKTDMSEAVIEHYKK